MNNLSIKNTLIQVIGVTGIAVLASVVQAASFDCAKSAARIEKLICSDESTSKLDVDLADAYKEALGKAEDKNTLTQQQRTWLKVQRNACKDVACLSQAYRLRIDELIGLSASVVEDNALNHEEYSHKKYITFTLVEGDGYPLCKEYVEMLNKTQYTEMPVCGRKILPEFKNFKEITWSEIIDKNEVIKVIEGRYEVQMAFNPRRQKQNYSSSFDVDLIEEKKLKMYFYRFDFNNDHIDDVIYKKHINPKHDNRKFGLCETIDSFYIDDSKITIDSLKHISHDPYKAFNFSGSNDVFLYGDDLYVANYFGKSYRHVNFEIYGVGNKKICGILAK